jgi:orotidine-5'-phosphate decarboxylase
MTTTALVEQIKLKKSFLCVGLDVDLDKIPKHLLDLEDPIFEFCKTIIDATSPYCVAYKPNIAFFEAYGLKGWQSLERVIQYLNTSYPEQFTIADAKRGDIGNTATRYAKAFFDQLQFDALTVAPYMGQDSVEPFLAFEAHHTILLALTSNSGASDFQYTKESDQPLYLKVIEKAQNWKGSERLMYVVGATKTAALRKIRSCIPNAFLLVPGVGAQGGSLDEVAAEGLNKQCGLLVNSSRGIIYAASDESYAEAAADAARVLQNQMAHWLSQKAIV